MTALPMLFTLWLPAQAVNPPDPTVPGAGARQVAVAEGRGLQIYSCQTQADSAAWVLQAPAATLFAPGTTDQLGTHGAGPTWTWADGSSLTGKVLQKKASENAASVPWLLLETHPNGTMKGALSEVSFVRRSNTAGGNAPATGCDAGHLGSVIRIPYTATYTFYTTGPR